MAVGSISVNKNTCFRLAVAVSPIALALGITALLLFVFPPVKEAVRQGLEQGGPLLKWLVFPPAIVMAVLTTVLAFKILWNASEPHTSGPEENN